MNAVIEQARERIIALCKAHGVAQFDVFGSALGDSFDEHSSDLDAAVDFVPSNDGGGLRRYLALKQELESVLGRSVDLVELKAMPDSRLKRIIERSKVPLYAAAG